MKRELEAAGIKSWTEHRLGLAGNGTTKIAFLTDPLGNLFIELTEGLAPKKAGSAS